MRAFSEGIGNRFRRHGMLQRRVVQQGGNVVKKQPDKFAFTVMLTIQPPSARATLLSVTGVCRYNRDLRDTRVTNGGKETGNRAEGLALVRAQVHYWLVVTCRETP